MKHYKVSYYGNSCRFSNFYEDVYASSERDAVLKVVNKYLDFFEVDGLIYDSDGQLAMGGDWYHLRYDGGWFSADIQGTELSAEDKNFDKYLDR